MNSTFCDDGHQYGLWSINEGKNEGIRTCKKCNYTEILPLTDDIREQDKKRKEAKLFLEAFSLVSNDDDKMIGYISLLFDDYITYFDDEQLKMFNGKIDEYKKTSLIDVKNATLLTSMQSSFNSDLDNFFDLLEEFQSYNQDVLTFQQESGYTK